MTNKIKKFIKNIEEKNKDEIINFIKFDNQKCHAFKNSKFKNIQCTHKKINGTMFCGRHRSFTDKNVDNTKFINIITNFLINENKLLTELKNLESFLNNPDNNISDQDIVNNNTFINHCNYNNHNNKYNCNNLHTFIDKYYFINHKELFGEYLDNQNMLKNDSKLYNSTNNINSSIEKDNNILNNDNIISLKNNKDNDEVENNLDDKIIKKCIKKRNSKTKIIIPINENPYKKNIITLRRSLVSNEYYKKLIHFKQKINNYITTHDKNITLMDYIIDNELNNFSQNKILQSFSFYKLIYLESQLIELSKIKENRNNYDVELFAKKKLEYSIIQLKSLFETLYLAMKNYNSIILIQKNFRIYNLRKNVKLRGFACYNRDICVNQTDFYTMEDISDIPNNEFYSYTDDNKFTYGFHIDSIWELIKKKKNKILNPYNRDLFKDFMKDQVTVLHKIKKQNIKVDKNKISPQLLVKSKCIDLFSKIDMFGYQTQIEWLYNQSPVTLRYFYRKLVNLWNYKLGLSYDLKDRILPLGDLININRNLSNPSTVSNNNKFKLLDKILVVLDALVTQSPNLDDRNMGAIIILHALAEISNDCVTSNPWLL